MNMQQNRLQDIGRWSLTALLSGVAVILLGMAQILPVSAQLPLDSGIRETATSPAEAAALQTPSQPLGELLNEDGSLNLESGYRGSIDATGYKLVSDEGEAPRFGALSSVPGDEKWQEGFGPGVGNFVHALALDGTGNLYAGGYFTTAGGAPANHIAKWDGISWSVLGSGMTGAFVNPSVDALAFDNAGNLYAAGYFAYADGVLVNSIAKWDGSSWSALSTGLLNGFPKAQVYALAFDDAGNLFAGGIFKTAGGIAASNIAKWDGDSWSALGAGITGPTLYPAVYSLTVDDLGNLYAGGDFLDAGGILVNHIAKWDGSNWSALGIGVDDIVHTLAVDEENNLYAGGDFSIATDVFANSIAMWDGSKWSSLGSGLNDRASVLAFGNSGNLLVGGDFTDAGGVTTNYLAKWDGNNWSPISSELDNAVQALAFDSAGYFYAGGEFINAGGLPMRHITKWNGAGWSPLRTGMSGNGLMNGSGWPDSSWRNTNVLALSLDESGNLYAGGVFTDAGGVPVNRIAKWDGISWSALEHGLSNSAKALALDSLGNLFTTEFQCVRDYCWYQIAIWHGDVWTFLEEKINGEINTLVFKDNGDLYVGGNFTRIGTLSASHIAKWDGINWSPLGSGLGGGVNSLVFDSVGNLFAGGGFTNAGEVPARRIAKWDGSNWSGLGIGANDTIFALATDGAVLYAGGDFTDIGGVFAEKIAMWDSGIWSPLGSGINGRVNALALGKEGELYAGGEFTNAGDIAAWGIAKWDGNKWYALGGGMGSGAVHALAIDEMENLYVGGEFRVAGHNLSTYIGLWNDMPIRVVKRATPEMLQEPGGSVSFVITVNNISLLDSVSITTLIDDIHGDLNGKGTCSVPQTIVAGGSYSCSYSVNVSGNSGYIETSTVMANGTDAAVNLISHSGKARVTIIDLPSAVEVVKTATPEKIREPGGSIDFDITVTNTSSTDRTITISEMSDDIHGDLNGQGGCATPQTIGKNYSYSCSFTADVNGLRGHIETNVVTATGTDDLGYNPTATDDATVTITKKKDICIPIPDEKENVSLICF